MKLTSLLTALLLAAALPVAAQMNYQGRLTDASGNPLADGQQTLEFSLWDVATGGTAAANQIWGPYTLDGTAGRPKADLVGGSFNVVFGPLDSTNRPLTGAFNGPRFLQIKVGTNSPITPRQQILAAPDAIHAQMASTVPNGAIGTAQLANLAVTGAKIADNTIPVSKLTGAGANFWDGNTTDVFRATGNVGIGVLAPAEKLDIAGNVKVTGNVTASGNVSASGNISAANVTASGDIKLGPTGQYFAPAAEENLRMVRGNVAAVGPYSPGHGFTASRTDVPNQYYYYTITFTIPFPTGEIPTVVASASWVFGGSLPAVVRDITNEGFKVNIASENVTSGRDGPFQFIAVGIR